MISRSRCGGLTRGRSTMTPTPTLDDLREALTTLEDLEGTTRRVLGGAHPVTEAVGTSLREARAAFVAREVA